MREVPESCCTNREPCLAQIPQLVSPRDALMQPPREVKFAQSRGDVIEWTHRHNQEVFGTLDSPHALARDSWRVEGLDVAACLVTPKHARRKVRDE
jgi:hypothetical protein